MSKQTALNSIKTTEFTFSFLKCSKSVRHRKFLPVQLHSTKFSDRG